MNHRESPHANVGAGGGHTIIENGYDKHHEGWEIEFPYQSQQHEAKLSQSKGRRKSQSAEHGI